jgi:hypothetical protein
MTVFRIYFVVGHKQCITLSGKNTSEKPRKCKILLLWLIKTSTVASVWPWKKGKAAMASGVTTAPKNPHKRQPGHLANGAARASLYFSIYEYGI